MSGTQTLRAAVEGGDSQAYNSEDQDSDMNGKNKMTQSFSSSCYSVIDKEIYFDTILHNNMILK